jgi:hypothetical protein
MMSHSLFRSRFIAGGLAAAFFLLILPLPAPAQSRQGTLQGTVFSEGMRSRVSSAVVKLRNLNDQREYVSQPSDPKGNYKILMIEEGWYTLGVSTAAGDFNLNYGIYVKAGEIAKLSVTLLPGGMLEGTGSNGGKKSFFSKPEGIALIVVAAGGLAFGIYELTKPEKEASPVR